MPQHLSRNIRGFFLPLTHLENASPKWSRFVTNTTGKCPDTSSECPNVSPKAFCFVDHLWPCTCRTSCMRPDLQLRWSQCCGRWTVMALLSPSTLPLLSGWPPPTDRAASPSSRPRPPPSPWWLLTHGLPQTQRWFQTIIPSLRDFMRLQRKRWWSLFEVELIFNNQMIISILN